MLGRYDSIEFDTVEYMASSGGLSCPDSDARMAYNNASGLPQLDFNGGNTMVGAGAEAVNGSVYDPVVLSLLDDPTPVAMAITDFSFASGSAFITVDIELEGDLPFGSQSVLRVAIMEDELSYSGVTYHHILVDMLRDTDLTINSAGQTQSETIVIDIDPAWNTDHLHATAFVQDDTNREILQSCNTRPTPEYSLRYYASGPSTVISGRSHTFGDAGLFNTGLTSDTYTVSLDAGDLPPDGSAHFLYEGTAYTTLSVALAPGERAKFNMVIDNGSGFEGAASLVFHSQSEMIDDRRLDYKMISADTDILLVDDDGAFDYETLYFIPALAGTGKSHAVWDRGTTAVDGPTLANFDIVIWNCGWAFPSVDASDRAALTDYLDGGGNLFITGQDIGWDMYDQGGQAQVWYNTYLHANYINDDTNDLTLDGVAGTFTEGLSLAISGGDGANNQDYPSDIDPRDEFSSSILTYSVGRNGGIMADTGTHRVVYLSFGYEAINNAADRASLMEGIVAFLAGSTSTVGGSNLPGAMALLGNTPNPFNPQTEISFHLAADSQVKLEVFDVRGYLVRTLAEGHLSAGENRVNWDGRDNSGHTMPSGTYFYRLTGPDKTLSDKMMLVR